ncbi:MAG: carbon storage regulator CsrA [Phycisphaeraceae bacterium]|nr:carbon storage regulator CsrA [Phycisphaerales bacterium]MCB9861457.1 carbon storage regulator CsrA [Phycisphaeraceae bacterium]
MLVLSRHRDETIIIGDEVEITVVDIRGDKVRLGISAPSTVDVHRKEVYLAIQVENHDARESGINEQTDLSGLGSLLKKSLQDHNPMRIKSIAVPCSPGDDSGTPLATDIADPCNGQGTPHDQRIIKTLTGH